MKNICVFASSSQNLENCFYRDALEMGAYIGMNGYNIVYGGSRLGLMYACASSVKENGGQIIGVMPERLAEMGCANPDDCDEFVLTKGMRERKAVMDEKSSSVIALAGGFGTLEEVSEMIVQKQLGYNNKPIVLLNTNGFYDNLIKFFNVIIDNKFAKDGSENLYYLAKTPKNAIEYILTYKDQEVSVASKY